MITNMLYIDGTIEKMIFDGDIEKEACKHKVSHQGHPGNDNTLHIDGAIEKMTFVGCKNRYYSLLRGVLDLKMGYGDVFFFLCAAPRLWNKLPEYVKNCKICGFIQNIA